MINIHLYIIIILFSILRPNGILSDNYQKSINYSLGVITDNETYKEENEDGDLKYKDIKSRLFNANLNMVFKGKFEIGVDYINNNTVHNSFDLPLKGSYNHLNFSYYLKDMKKIPINFLFGVELGNNGDWQSISYNFAIYKEFNLELYPLIPILQYSSTNIDYNSNKISYNSFKIDFIIKLVVDTSENNPVRDIIWIAPSIISKDKDQYFGINLGLYHPIR